MLVLRRAEVEAELAETAARLGRVESQIERLEHQMSDQPRPTVAVTTKRLPSVHLAVASGVSLSFGPEHIGPTIQPLYPVLLDSLAAAGVGIEGPSIAYYDEAEDGSVAVHAGFPVAESVTEVPGLEIVDLPEVELAATAVHHGDMATCRRRHRHADPRVDARARLLHDRVLAGAVPRLPAGRPFGVADRDAVPDRDRHIRLIPVGS